MASSWSDRTDRKKSDRRADRLVRWAMVLAVAAASVASIRIVLQFDRVDTRRTGAIEAIERTSATIDVLDCLLAGCPRSAIADDLEALNAAMQDVAAAPSPTLEAAVASARTAQTLIGDGDRIGAAQATAEALSQFGRSHADAWTEHEAVLAATLFDDMPFVVASLLEQELALTSAGPMTSIAERLASIEAIAASDSTLVDGWAVVASTANESAVQHGPADLERFAMTFTDLHRQLRHDLVASLRDDHGARVELLTDLGLAWSATIAVGAAVYSIRRSVRRRLRALLGELDASATRQTTASTREDPAEASGDPGGMARDDEWSEVRRASRALMSSLNEATARVEFAVTHDTLTGLPNRRGLLGRIRDEEAPSVIFFVDLDRFKVINDGFGPAWGDALLIAVADRLRSAVRMTDVVGRIAGDEFVVVLGGSPGGAAALENAERIAESLSRPYVLHHEDDVRCVQINASIGVASTDTGGVATIDRMIGHADLAMHEAKRLGGSRVLPFRDEFADRQSASLSLTTNLMGAMTRGELLNHYQPIVRASDRRVVGYEALLRWDQPGRGVVPPGVFLDAAAASGLIRPIGRAAVQRACVDCQALRTGGQDVSVAVNVSAVELVPALLRLTEEALATSGLDPSALHLEITESVLMADAETSARRLRDLRRLGIHVSLDDFGTGYSSLSYLARFPVDAVKVDRSFVERIDDADGNALGVVRAIVNMCHDLGHTVVAEGVETPRQADLLASLGIDQLQGWLFGRPVSLGELLPERAEGPAVEVSQSSPTCAEGSQVHRGSEQIDHSLVAGS